MDDATRTLELARLRLLAAKVGMVHGPGHPAMVELAALVGGLAERRAVGADEAVRLRALCDGFRPWPGACASVRGLYAGLEAIAAGAQP